jgi:hypothetical protein
MAVVPPGIFYSALQQFSSTEIHIPSHSTITMSGALNRQDSVQEIEQGKGSATTYPVHMLSDTDTDDEESVKKAPVSQKKVQSVKKKRRVVQPPQPQQQQHLWMVSVTVHGNDGTGSYHDHAMDRLKPAFGDTAIDKHKMISIQVADNGNVTFIVVSLLPPLSVCTTPRE